MAIPGLFICEQAFSYDTRGHQGLPERRPTPIPGMGTRRPRLRHGCTASGFLKPGTEVAFRLEDRLGRLLAAESRPLTVRSKTDPHDVLTRRSPPAPCWIGQSRWEPPLAEPGFYRVRASLVGVPTTAGRDQLNLAIVTSWPTPAQSEFGWTLPRTRQPRTQPRLVELLSQAGIRWVKYPSGAICRQTWLRSTGRLLSAMPSTPGGSI